MPKKPSPITHKQVVNAWVVIERRLFLVVCVMSGFLEEQSIDYDSQKVRILAVFLLRGTLTKKTNISTITQAM